jgi:hypothetical protein
VVELRPQLSEVDLVGHPHARRAVLDPEADPQVAVTAEDHLRHQQLVEIRIEQGAHDRVDAEIVVVDPLREVDHGPSVFGKCRPSLGRIAPAINADGSGLP